MKPRAKWWIRGRCSGDRALRASVGVRVPSGRSSEFVFRGQDSARGIPPAGSRHARPATWFRHLRVESEPRRRRVSLIELALIRSPISLPRPGALIVPVDIRRTRAARWRPFDVALSWLHTRRVSWIGLVEIAHFGGLRTSFIGIRGRLRAILGTIVSACRDRQATRYAGEWPHDGAQGGRFT